MKDNQPENLEDIKNDYFLNEINDDFWKNFQEIDK